MRRKRPAAASQPAAGPPDEPESPSAEELRRRANDARLGAAAAIEHAEAQAQAFIVAARAPAGELAAQAGDDDETADTLEEQARPLAEVSGLRARLLAALADCDQTTTDLDGAEARADEIAGRVSTSQAAAHESQRRLDEAVTAGVDPAELVRLVAARDAAAAVPALIEPQSAGAEQHIEQLESRLDAIAETAADVWDDLDRLDALDGLDWPEHVFGPEPEAVEPELPRWAFDEARAEQRRRIAREQTHLLEAFDRMDVDRLYRVSAIAAEVRARAERGAAIASERLGREVTVEQAFQALYGYPETRQVDDALALAPAALGDQPLHRLRRRNRGR